MSEHGLKATPEPLHLTVHSLPAEVAEEIRHVQDRNPELLRHILVYGMVHKEVFETLSRHWPV